MSRLTDEELARLAEIANTHTGGIMLGQVNARKLFDELRERRSHDLNLARLSDVCRDYFERCGRYPHGTTTALLDAIDAMLEGRER